MAEDLAIDVGLQIHSDDYKTFVACVNAILDHGCSYSERTMRSIKEYCKESDLPLAKKVLRECDRIANNSSRMRPSKLKWWETYEPRRRKNYNYRRERNASESRRQRNVDTRERPSSRRPKRPMDLEFKRKPQPMELKFEKKKRPRPMSPVPEDSPTYHRKRYRPMSPVYSDVPRWPSRKRSRY